MRRLDASLKKFPHGLGRTRAIGPENSRLDFKAVLFINRPLETVAKPQRQSKAGTHLPRILHVLVISLVGEVSGCGRTRRQKIPVFSKGVVRNEFREAANYRCRCILDFSNRVQCLSSTLRTREIVVSKEGLELVGHMGTSPCVERGVCFPEIKCVGIADASVTGRAYVRTKLDGVITFYPRKVVREIMDGSHSSYGMSLTIGLKYKPEVLVVSSTVSTIGECLPGKTIAEAVDPIRSNTPRVAKGNTPGMVPDYARRHTRKKLRKGLVIIDDIGAYEGRLARGQVEIELGDVGIQFCRGG